MNALRHALFVVGVLLASWLAAQKPCMPAKPANEDHLVYQFTPLLEAHDVERLDNKLRRFAQETSNRILVVVVDDLCDMEPWQFATELGEAWGIGNKGFDNGVVVLVKPTGPPGERKIFIATGRGLEGAIPDAMAGRIVQEQIIPRFREGQYDAGLEKATDTLMALAKGEYHEKSITRLPWWAALLVPGVFLLVIVLVVMAWHQSVKGYARANNIDFWTAYLLMSQMRRKHSGRWDSFTGGGGGGWSGGGGGGGFGGFGGGSFGGGGAGGSW